MQPVYEDNHIIIVNKAPGEIVQGDKTSDKPLSEIVKEWLKEKYAKPGNVFLGVAHRLDRPVAGLVIFAKTSKALARLNEMFRNGEVHKTYRAITRNTPPKESDELLHYITTVEKTNKSYTHTLPCKNGKEARLRYKLLSRSDRYNLIEVELLTGRKHQIRVQLAAIGCPIRGDLKYGDKRSNPDGSISLMAHRVRFTHPVSGKEIDVTAPLPQGEPLWEILTNNIDNDKRES
ncbi:MAG: RNA pseudouridine synthase [Muribaculaceae bacterium]|nr:RNA pseudouridine synthase [Muribaculaceae bacterium]